MSMFTVELHYHGDLAHWLPPNQRDSGLVRRVLCERTGVKDAIEACGIPHTEIDLILVQTEAGTRVVDFSWRLESDISLEIHPAPAPAELLPEIPRLQTRHCSRFVADGHLGKLAQNLRLLGIDTIYERDASDRRLIELMLAENRALLTRDRRLLMHSVVRDGYCPRSDDPETQTREVLRRFVASPLAPYSRCLRCNGRLEPVEKREVTAALAHEPLTLRFYDDFQRCTGCGRIYWPGTHFKKLADRLARITGGAEEMS